MFYVHIKHTPISNGINPFVCSNIDHNKTDGCATFSLLVACGIKLSTSIHRLSPKAPLFLTCVYAWYNPDCLRTYEFGDLLVKICDTRSPYFYVRLAPFLDFDGASHPNAKVLCLLEAFVFY